jgi:phage shock protein A
MTVHSQPRTALHQQPDKEGQPARRWAVLAIAALLSAHPNNSALAQTTTAPPASSETTEQKVQQLTAAVARAQSQMDSYQKQLQELQRQLSALQGQLAAEKANPPAPSAPPGKPAVSVSSNAQTGVSTSASGSAIEDIRERQAVQESQIATHEQTKVETESKYPLKVSGLLLFNGYVNTRQVDVSADPTYALSGGGSTGLSLRQTVLGLDARGPHLFGATSHADVRVDFFASGGQSGYAAGGVLRLRTAHAGLKWQNTEAFVQQDRSFLAPNAPSSLIAVAQPEFAWSGNLWAWNPQIGLSHQVGLSGSKRLKFEAGLIDLADPQFPGVPPGTSTVSRAERSRWPGSEARIAFASGDADTGPEVGASGYFSPHKTGDQKSFDAWAGAIDLRLPISRHFAFTTSAYRGAALGGLGGGGYVDYVDLFAGTAEIARALDDVGGWAQLKSKVGERLEFNTGYGVDNPFAREIHASMMIPEYSIYSGLARNRSAVANVIYSPSSYLLFSLEYRRLWTNYATGPTNFSDVIGFGAGYRF